jgi:hypothetical protein
VFRYKKHIVLYKVSYAATSVSDPDPVGSAFKLGLDPGSGSVFGIRIRIPDPGSKNRLKKLKFTRTDFNDENRKMLRLS